MGLVGDALLAAGDLSVTALEIPTGWAADRYGHRISLITGSLAQVAGILVCWLAAGVTGLLRLFCSSPSVTRSKIRARSGPGVDRLCMALEREPDFQRIEARTHGIQLVALMTLVLAGGVIVETWGFAIGWLVETAIGARSDWAVACAMVEPPACADQTPDD